MSQELILEKIEKLIEIANEIAELDEIVGNVFLMNIKNSMDILSATVKEEPLDLSEKIEFISQYLGIDLEELVKEIVEKDFTSTQSGTLISSEEIDKDAVDFIINNTKNIDDYEKFLQENSVKENLNYLKENL